MSDIEHHLNGHSSSSQNSDLYAEQNNFIEVSVESTDGDDNIEYVEYTEDDYLIEVDNDLANDCNLDSDKRTEHIPDNRHSASLDKESSTSQDSNDLDVYHCSTCNINFHSVTEHINKYHKLQSVIYDGVETNIQPKKQEKNAMKETVLESKMKSENLLLKSEDSLSEDKMPKDGSFEDQVQIKSENLDEIEEFDMYAYTIQEFLDSEGLEMAEVEYIDETSTNNTPPMQMNDKEEMFFDTAGRPYIRKKVKIDIINLETCKQANKANIKNSRSPKDEMNAVIKKEDTNDDMDLSPDWEPKYQTTPSSRHNSKSSELIKPIKARKKNIKEQVLCEICNTIFPSNKSYRLHSRMHEPIKVRSIEEAIGYEMKSSAKDGKLSNELFFCDICQKSYDMRFEEIHKKSHKSGQTFICTTCNKKFANEVNLNMHLKAHEENPKQKPPTKAELAGTQLPYECAYCGRQFARPHEKVKHERIHTGEKPYKCEICGKVFRVAYCLTLHLRTHTAARPYVCPHCNKRFKAYSGYNHHLMTHSDERPYKCPHCSKAFKTSVQLAGHKNSHTKPFSCPDCNRPFGSLYAVKAHIQVHKYGSQTLKHRCQVCGATYGRVFALKDHMKEQHPTKFVECDETHINITEEEPFLNENETSAQSILPENVEEITIGEMDYFQAEEVVTDWLK